MVPQTLGEFLRQTDVTEEGRPQGTTLTEITEG